MVEIAIADSDDSSMLGVIRFQQLCKSYRCVARFQRARRIWFLDNKLLHIGREIRKDLGAWQIRRLSKGIDVQSALASEDIASCGIQIEVLRQEWVAQKQAQCSVRSRTLSPHLFRPVNRQSTADAPAVMKKNLTKLLDIQQKVDILSNTVSAAMSSLGTTGGSNSEIQDALARIESYQSGLMTM